MRIQLVLGNDTDESGITEATYNMLRETIPAMWKVELTSENPDIIHVLGEWNKETMSIARDAISRHIAIVYSPLSSMAPWKNPSSARTKLTYEMEAIIVGGQIELEYLEDEKTPSQTRIIRNAVTTSTISREEMCTQIMTLYKEVIETVDKQLWEQAEAQTTLINEKDNTIKDLCKYFIYASALNRRRNIPRRFLNELTDKMHKSEFNEDNMAKILKMLKLYEFIARLEIVMKNDTKLMEGYMPIPAIDDKTTKKIASYITNY